MKTRYFSRNSVPLTAVILLFFRGDPRVHTTFSPHSYTPTRPSTITRRPAHSCTDHTLPCTTPCVFGSTHSECQQIQQRAGKSRPRCSDFTLRPSTVLESAKVPAEAFSSSLARLRSMSSVLGTLASDVKKSLMLYARRSYRAERNALVDVFRNLYFCHPPIIIYQVKLCNKAGAFDNTRYEVLYRNHRNCTDYRNYTNQTYRCDPLSHSVGLRLIV